MNNPFHYAFTVKDLETTRFFYGELLNCTEARSTDSWVDFDFFGHQISAHIGASKPLNYAGKVDNIAVPIPHFGCILEKAQFDHILQKFEANQIEFIIKPQTRYAGKNAQQQTLFVLDLSGNPLEFKTYSDPSQIFSTK